MAHTAVQMTTLNPGRAKLITFPREHGAWGMLLVPLVTGAVVGAEWGGERWWSVIALGVAAISIFILRTPAEALMGSGVIKVQTPAEREAAWRALKSYLAPLILSIGTLLQKAPIRLWMTLGVVGVVAFVAQTLVGRRTRESRTAAQMIGAIGLTSTAAAAYLAITGDLPRVALQLWALNWLFAAEQISFVQLRIKTAKAPDRAAKWRAGKPYMIGAAVITAVLVLSAVKGWLGPAWVVLGFLPVMLRAAWWFATEPKPIALKKLGFMELAFSIVFGVVVIAAF